MQACKIFKGATYLTFFVHVDEYWSRWPAFLFMVGYRDILSPDNNTKIQEGKRWHQNSIIV